MSIWSVTRLAQECPDDAQVVWIIVEKRPGAPRPGLSLGVDDRIVGALGACDRFSGFLRLFSPAADEISQALARGGPPVLSHSVHQRLRCLERQIVEFPGHH